MLSTPWNNRKDSYDFVIIGSGYGGAITAARLAAAAIAPKPSVCILERGREWQAPNFPETLEHVLRETRSDANPLGLYELLNHRDISIIKGSGLGGTSLINANVAIMPDREVFEQFHWPASIRYDAMVPFYNTARAMLAAGPHPRARQLPKVQALDRRAREFGASAEPLDIAVNFTVDGPNPHGAAQKPCIDCGNCVTGCNVNAKNTLYMNYLPAARNAGAAIFTQTKVEWIEKRGDGWRIHGRHVEGPHSSKTFTMDAANIVLAAGSLNSTEILLRSEMHGLSVSPALGARFNGNGDFFGLAYNGAFETDVLGYKPTSRPGAGESPLPGPNIAGVIRYNGALPVEKRIAIEDFSFPAAYVDGSKILFASLRGQDTYAGDEDAQRARVLRDLNLLNPAHLRDGAMNHTMLYLVMGFDNARGVILFEAPWTEPDGRIRVSWDQAGQQQIFTRMNDELRRHARALHANFISNPTWSVFQIGHLITAHPLGGCPMGDNYLEGAVDPFGRVFAGDGAVHKGLYVSDGSVLPSAIGVNPFLTISALTERFAARKIRELQGEAYPEPDRPVSMSTFDARQAIGYGEGQLEALFRRTRTQPLDRFVNRGGPPALDIANKTIRNDSHWKGFFPKGHVLNAMSSALFTGFRKQFSKDGNRYTGITSDTDGRIRARNSLEEIELKEAKGALEAGRYILLRYLDPPWQGFYDVFKMVNDDLLIGRVYLGDFPNGIRLFTFPMTRTYGFDQMTVADHRALYEPAPIPTTAQLEGAWRMDVISNANQAGGVAYLQFRNKPDGRLEARYRLMGLLEGLVLPSFVADHFQLNDFTPFHDEIRRLNDNLMIGRYLAPLPAVLASGGANSLGIFHTQPDGQFGFYYLLTKVEDKDFRPVTILRPFLETQLPDGLGLIFDEEMAGSYYPGQSAVPATVTAPGAVPCSFQARMTAPDINAFVDGYEHEAFIKGRIAFGDFLGQGPATFPILEPASRFHYLRVNEVTQEAEMRYHIEFAANTGRRFTLDGTKFMQRGRRGVGEVLEDYTTLFCHLYEELPQGGRAGLGTALLKFRTFEDLAAVGNLAGFLASFQVTGTDDPLLKLQAQMRFLAFTAQFVQYEYDPLSFGPMALAQDVAAEVRRGADTPDFFSTRSTDELQAILRDTPTLPIDTLLNRGAVAYDFDKKRVFRDSFWKGSFAKDSLLGWEERARQTLLNGAERTSAAFAGGSFWKRFDSVANGVAKGYVVNYQIDALPGLPEVRQIAYPNNHRRYFKKDDPVLLLTYTNEPYRIVYDTIKVIDEQNAIGVMHLGEFPNGIEFATFVMARHNYPFEHMSIQDHDALFADPRTTTPDAAGLLGAAWHGHLIYLDTPDTSIANQAGPAVATVTFSQAGSQLEVRWSPVVAGQVLPEIRQPCPLSSLRLAGRDTLLAKWSLPGTGPDGLLGRLALDRVRLVLTKM